jgi:hypothetical protein
VSTYRLYWLGAATEPGKWAIDTGPGSRVWRVHDFRSRDAESAEHAEPVAGNKPSGWIIITPDTCTVRSPEGTFWGAALDDAYLKYSVDLPGQRS